MMKRRPLFIPLLLLLLLSTCWQSVQAQTDFREETIYFLLTSRFFDGDPANSAATEWSSYNADPTINPTITDPQDVTWRGDFKGLIQKLDYIQDLGFTAIWITPIVHNRSPLDYHGYHAWDFTKVDPRLESPGATFQDLIDAVHARGMKIVLDVVTNHAGRFGIKDVAEIKYNTDPTQPWYAADNPNWEYDGITPNPDDGKIWSRANLAKLPPPYNQNLAAYQWPNTVSYVDTTDPDWYHHSGNGFAQGFDDTENLQNRALAGDTPDLNTGSPILRNYLFQAYKTFIDMGVDAFRWDTMKHMSREDVLWFHDAFKSVNPDLFVFGEVAQLRHELHPVEEINPHYYTWRGAVNNSQPSGIAVIDFFAEATFHGTFEEGQSFSTVKAASRYDHLYSDPSTLVTWLDNHDFGPNNDWNRRYGGSDENLAAAMNFMFTWRGIPAVYYGTEMRFKAGEFADIHDASGIEKSIDETGRAYYGDVMDQAPGHPIYQHIKKLNAIRRAVPALQKGAWNWVDAPGNAVAYRRVYNEGGTYSEVAVGLSKDGGASFNFSGMSNGTYRDAVTGREVFVSNGNLSFSVTSGSAGIYVLDGPGMIGACNAGFFEACVTGPSLPVVTFTPAASQSENPIDVSLQAQGGSGVPYSIYYTTDGSSPSTASTQYSGPITVSSTTTIKAIAVDGAGNQSTEAAKTYTIGAIQGLSVHLWKPSGWGTPNVHYWNESPDVLPASNWPGPQMSQEGSSNWYSYTFAGVSSTNLLFSNNAASQTADLFRDQEGWYYNGAWYDQNPLGNQAPTLSASPAGGSYTDGETVSVTLSASDDSDPNPAIYYTLDGSTPTASSTAYSSALSISTTLTLKAIAIDSEGAASAVISHDFSFSPAPSGLTVHLWKPSGWGTPNVHYWNESPDVLPSNNWPGPQMSQEGSSNWYSYTFAGVSSTNLLFSNNAASQTADMFRDQDGWYKDGVWYDQNPDTNPPTGLTIHYKGSLSNPTIYFWNPTPGNASTSWPGEAMTADANGWYSYTISDANCSNIIFSSSGANQTADLYRCGEGWYYNGTWYGSAPASRAGAHQVPGATVSIYPQPLPGKGIMRVQAARGGMANVSIYTLTGTRVQHWQNHPVEAGNNDLPLTLTQAGVYLYQITLGHQTITGKIQVD